MKKFMIDSSDFERFIKEGYAYVDKTEIIHKLVSNTMGSKFFLSRPRRFGKSLLLSTIKYMFQGRRDLFKGLKIDSLDFNWEETYPILHLNMNECTGSIERVKEGVAQQLKIASKEHGIKIRDTNASLNVQLHSFILDLIDKSENKQIVLLVDEYDKPLLDHIGTKEVLPYQTFMKEFYTVIKDTEQYQRFTLITGVSKFSHVSIFSGLNNLVDLTMDATSSTLLGYTHEEMQDNFKENIQALADKYKVSYDEMFQKLIDQYDGYCFDEEMIPVFNPVSIGNCLTKLTLKNFWFATGTPGWLVSYMKRKPCFLADKIAATDIQLQSYNPEDPDIINLLLQTGYLTIKNVEDGYRGFSYILDFPNNEVRDGFSTYLMRAYISDDEIKNVATQTALIDSIYLGKPKDMIEAIKTFYASIPYDIQDKMGVEQAYQNVLFVLFSYLGLQATAEFKTNKGRIDILLQCPDFVYIIEVKINKPAQEAIDQIHEKGYYQQFKNSATKEPESQDADSKDSSKKLYLIGLSFSSEEKNITDHIIEEL